MLQKLRKWLREFGRKYGLHRKWLQNWRWKTEREFFGGFQRYLEKISDFVSAWLEEHHVVDFHFTSVGELDDNLPKWSSTVTWKMAEIWSLFVDSFENEATVRFLKKTSKFCKKWRKWSCTHDDKYLEKHCNFRKWVKNVSTTSNNQIYWYFKVRHKLQCVSKPRRCTLTYVGSL